MMSMPNPEYNMSQVEGDLLKEIVEAITDKLKFASF
jgi:hypothetical protein